MILVISFGGERRSKRPIGDDKIMFTANAIVGGGVELTAVNHSEGELAHIVHDSEGGVN